MTLAKSPSTTFSQKAEVAVSWKGFVVHKPVDPGLQVARLPAPDAGLGLAGLAHDRDGTPPIGEQQHDPRPPDMLLRAVPVGSDRRQTRTAHGRKPRAASFSHPRNLTQQGPDWELYVWNNRLAQILRRSPSPARAATQVAPRVHLGQPKALTCRVFRWEQPRKV